MALHQHLSAFSLSSHPNRRRRRLYRSAREGVEKALTFAYRDRKVRKREFRALAGLEHPNLIHLGELYCEDGTWFFTMELVDGVGFME